MKKLSIILIALIAFEQTAWAQFASGSGTQYDPYIINNETHWNNFCYALQQNSTWSQFSGKYYKLGADIGTSSNPVNTMAGSVGQEFCGTFDGNGKTIHISLNSTGNYTAIFRCVSNVGSNSATIKNLNVEGTVTAHAGHKYAGGLVGGCWDVITIENCRVSTVINSSVVGDGTHGGIVGVQNSGTLTITGCVFDGSIASANTNNPTSCCGGFMGWNSTSVTITDCLLAADMSSISSDDSYTFVRRGGNNTLTINNCYYLNPLGTTQGKVAYTRTETPANIGTQGTNHGIVQAYTYGLKYDGKYYVGSDSDLTVNNAGTEYTINTATGWNYFCAVLDENVQGYFTGKTVKLGNNITVSTMAGSDQHDFTGTFDGEGNTINIDSSNGAYTLFRNVINGNIQNLHVTGTINASAKYAAGLISSVWGGPVNIDNCTSSVTIVSSVSGDGTHGGFVAANHNSSTLNITGCVFDGKLLTTNGTTHCAGFVGYGTCNITNSLYAPATIGQGETEVGTNESATFARGTASGISINNCYYTKPLGTVQGKVAYTRTSTPANIGSQSESYGNGNVIAYTNGIKFNNKYYVGSDNNLTVNSAGTEYTINTATGWNYFCAILAENDKGFFTGKTVKLGNNITVSTMAGGSYHDFTGTFDGNSKTLTFNRGTSSQPFTEEYCAPFRYVEDATFNDLSVGGTIYTSNKYASGIAGIQNGTVTISNCRSSVIIHSSKSGDGIHGGIVGNQHAGTLTLSGCIFDGRMLTTNGTTHCSGLVGYHSGGTCTISNCLYAPAEVTLATGESYITSGATICRNYSGTPTNCYYTQPLGLVQGKVAYTRTNLPDNIGSQSASYGNGNVIAYTNDIKYNNKYYVGSDSDLTVDNEGTKYSIKTTAGWNYFCAIIAENAQGYFTGKTVKLIKSIIVGTMAGNSNRSFSGTFDGNSKTLTFNYSSSSQPFTEEYCAPFRYTNGATFNDLCVDGTIYTSQKYAAGFVSSASDSTAITNCRSNISIVSSVSSEYNDGTHGGFIACTSSDSRTSITGCVFDGSIASADTSSPTSRCGGFVGWNDNTSVTITITNCLLAADMSTISGTGSCTFVRPYNGLTITNSYYITAFGNTEQGTKVYSISEGEYVTTLENADTVSNNYTTSGLTFYNVGLKYGNVLYAPANNYVHLTLNHVNRENDGWFFDHYTVSAGTLTGTDNPYTLNMPSSVVTITAIYNNSPGGCPRPTNLAASNITDSSATLTWTSEAGGFEMEYALNSGTLWISVTEPITTNQYTLTGLASATTYKVRVLANCGTNSASAWSDIIIFTTLPGETPPEPTNHPSIENLQGKPQRFRIFRGLEVNGKQQPADWTNPDYWTGQGCPTDNDTVVIESGTICKVTNMEEIHYKKLYIIDDDSEMREQDQRAGQLLLPKGANVEATLIKRIHSWREKSFQNHQYGNIISGFGNWYLISFPTHVEELEDPNYLPDFEGAGMITSTNTYDLFFFQQAWWDPMMNDYYNLFDGGPADPTNTEAADGYKGCWRNYRYYLPGTHSFYDETEDATYWYTLNDFKADHNAYLYANYDQTDLHFTGPLYTQDSMVYHLYAATNADDVVFGTNLLGNPYPCNAKITVGEEVQEVFYQMEIDMNSKTAVRCDVMPTTISSDKDIVIAPMTAVFFLSNRASDWQGDGPTVTFKPYDPEAQGNTSQINYIRGENVNRNLNQLCIEVHEADTLRDRVYVKTGEGSSCSKFIFNPDTPKLFVPMGDKDYALAYTRDAKVMPLNFIYQKHGTYTLTFDTEAIECDYLHLIDNATGIDIDLYQTPSYTFNSRDCIYASRFKIVFDEEASDGIADSFAHISNGRLIINGTGTMQLIDITGHILRTENIRNGYSMSLNLSAGVYVVRLCNGRDVKTQKIVVD